MAHGYQPTLSWIAQAAHAASSPMIIHTRQRFLKALNVFSMHRDRNGR
jgi:hypothetical protein